MIILDDFGLRLYGFWAMPMVLKDLLNIETTQVFIINGGYYK